MVSTESHVVLDLCWKDRADSEAKFKSAPLFSEWMQSYLIDISLRLHRGGWETADIRDIMEVPASGSPSTKLAEAESKQSALDALSRQARSLSRLLREAGWSGRDVAEVLNVDPAVAEAGGHRRTVSKAQNLDLARPRHATRPDQVCSVRVRRSSLRNDVVMLNPNSPRPGFPLATRI